MKENQKNPQKYGQNFWSLICLALLFFALLYYMLNKLDLIIDKIDDVDVCCEEDFVVSDEICSELIFVDNRTDPVDQFKRNNFGQGAKPMSINQKYYCNQVVVLFHPDSNKVNSTNYLRDTLGLQKVRGCPNCGDLIDMELWGTDGDISISPEERDQIAMSDLGPLSGGIFTTFNYIIEHPERSNVHENGQNEFKPRNTDGKQVLVALIDTGIDFNNHAELKKFKWNNTSEFANLNNNDDDKNCIKEDTVGYDFVNNQTDVKDNDGHGTHVAGIIVNTDLDPNIVMNLKLMNLKIFDRKAGSLFNLVCALQYAIEKEADIINLSLGFYADDPPRTLDIVLDSANSKGILVISSSGNDGFNNNNLQNNAEHYPSSFNKENMIAVSALGQKRQSLWSNSNFGINKVDVAAPGEEIISTYINGLHAKLSGTSMAAGFVTKVAALYMVNNPGATAFDVKDCIINKATTTSNIIPSSKTVGTTSGKVARTIQECN